MGDALCDQLFVDFDCEFQHPSDADYLFSILETWEDCVNGGATAVASWSPTAGGGGGLADRAAAAATANKRPAEADATRQEECDGDRGDGTAQAQKRQKCSPPPKAAAAEAEEGAAPKTSHITVERNRRKQMNEHLAVLRSLMPCFYVKRGDQASIIGGVVDYIKELQQVLQSLETKKHRKAYTEQVLGPRPPSASSCSPRLTLSPRPPFLKSTPPLSPRLAVPISPKTPPTPGSPYKLRPRPPPGSNYVSPAITPTHEPASYLPTLDASAAELSVYANKQALLSPAGLLPDVRVEFAGANLVLKTVSHRTPRQAVKIIAALEGRSLEILQAKISTVDDTAVNSFIVKIGIECELSAEELVQEIQQTFT